MTTEHWRIIKLFMPTRREIQGEILKYKAAGQDEVRKRYLRELKDYTKRETISYFSCYQLKTNLPIPPALLSITNDDIQGFMASIHGMTGKELDLILHSPGGSLEAAEQIVQYLRSKFDHIRAIVPQNAMSAATMIACACDEIILGRESAIGPIDPQMSVPVFAGGAGLTYMSVPAHTILADFETARAEIGKNPALANFWVPKMQALPPGFFNFCQQTIELAKIKVETWLGQYMFRGGDGVLARELAHWLGNFEEHKTHGRPISFDLAAGKGLKVKRLEDDSELQERVLSYYHAAMVTFEVTPCLKMIENANGKGHFVSAQVQLEQG